MRRNYILLFVILVLIQVLVLDALYMGLYVAPLVYVGFVVMLPTDTKPITTLWLSLLLGLTVDLLSGEMGLNTIATLAVGYARPNVLRLVCGEDILRERAVAGVKRLGLKDFVVYTLIMTVGHSLLFFLTENLGLSHLPETLLKAACSGAATTVLLIIISMLFTNKRE